VKTVHFDYLLHISTASLCIDLSCFWKGQSLLCIRCWLLAAGPNIAALPVRVYHESTR